MTVDENVDTVTGELLDPELGRKSRAFSSIPYKHQVTTLGARKIVANYTLFRKALLPPGEVNKLVSRAWEHAYTGDPQIEFPDKAMVYVWRNCHPCSVGKLTGSS